MRDLESPDDDRLVAQLADYKRARWPRDRRIIAAVEVSPGGLRVQWLDDADLPSSATPVASIAQKVLARLSAATGNKVANHRRQIRGRSAAEHLQRTTVGPEQLAGMHPAHAAYVYTQNQVAILSEQLTALPEMAPLADMFRRPKTSTCRAGLR